jgi:hypothetical protein
VGGADVSEAFPIIAGLAVPAVTVTVLWFWRFRPRRQARLSPRAPLTEAQLAELVTGIYARQERMREQIAALGDGLADRDRRLAAHVSDLIETAAEAARIDRVAPAPQPGRRPAGESGPSDP